MVTTRHKVERTKKMAFWKPHITAWRQTNLGATAYCRQHGLSLHKFKYWQYQIAKDNLPGQQKIEQAQETEKAFIEVTQAQQEPAPAHRSPVCIIETQYGFSIIVSEELSSQTLQNMFQALKVLT